MSLNSILLTKLIKLDRKKLISIINPQHHSLPTSLIFQEIFKLLRPSVNLIFSSKKYTHVLLK
jgi:hypothetical protein